MASAPERPPAPAQRTDYPIIIHDLRPDAQEIVNLDSITCSDRLLHSAGMSDGLKLLTKFNLLIVECFHANA
jgi:hypothetical protein